MKIIYLLRHFKVHDLSHESLNSHEFEAWVEKYDLYDLEYIDLTLPTVDKIYVSSQNRAIKTAKHLKVAFEVVDNLKEVEAKAFFGTKMRFSKTFWLVVGRLLWYFDLAQSENKTDTIKRAKKVINDTKEESVLFVSHWLFLKILIKELRKMGYRGKSDIRLKNGILYKFEI